MDRLMQAVLYLYRTRLGLIVYTIYIQNIFIFIYIIQVKSPGFVFFCRLLHYGLVTDGRTESREGFILLGFFSISSFPFLSICFNISKLLTHTITVCPFWGTFMYLFKQKILFNWRGDLCLKYYTLVALTIVLIYLNTTQFFRHYRVLKKFSDIILNNFQIYY